MKIIKMKTKIFSVLAAGLMVLSSCSDDENPYVQTTGEIKNYTFLDARAYSDWVYFSFEQGEIVEVADFQNDLNWDIAFHRGDIRLNGGKSGEGLGEAVNTYTTDWNAVSAAPSSGYVKDEIGIITIAFIGTGVIEEDQPFSQTMSTWLTVDTTTPPPVYTLNNWIYVLKTADGKFVKIQIYDNKNETGNAGYVSFKYQYNTDGGSDF